LVSKEVIVDTKNNSRPGSAIPGDVKDPANAATKNGGADKKIEETNIAKNNLPGKNNLQTSTNGVPTEKTAGTNSQNNTSAKITPTITTQQDKTNETKTEDLAKAKPVAEQKNAAKQDIAITKNQPLTASANPTEAVITKADNKTATNTTGSNPKPEATTNGFTVKNNTPAEKKETVKQGVAVVKNQNPSASVKQTETVAIKPDNKTATNSTVLNTKPEATNTSTVAKNNAVGEQKEKTIIPIAPEVKKPEADITLKAAMIAGRKSEFNQVVNFKSDSLQISLYDNGEIDGDTVSVFMNGEVILAQQGLKSSAIKKTIYLAPGQNDEFTLVMFAESLGKYPPNTGLLVIRDGDDIYNLRFSSDFQKNAGIVFRRKK